MQGKDNQDVQAHYDVPTERIVNDARNAETLIVFGMKGGKPVLWSNTPERKAQELLTQFFPEANLELPESVERAIG
jgi:hypothetical protein